MSMGDFLLLLMSLYGVYIPCMRSIFLCLFLLLALQSATQTLGGQAAYSFLKLSPSPLQNAVGGINTSLLQDDLSLAWHNPAFLRKGMENRMSANFQLFYAGLRTVHAQGAVYSRLLGAVVSAGIHYLPYGQTSLTDAAGNVLGNFNANDYVVQTSAGWKYLENWHYGVTFKYIHSAYGPYRSQAIAMDMGLNYLDTVSQLQIGFVAKNMGLQLQTYAGQGEDMPFDLQLGITKRMVDGPFQFSLTAQRLHQFDLIYRDTTLSASGLNPGPKDNFINNLFRHFVFAVQTFIGDRVDVGLGYNVLRRSELNLFNAANGLTGFSYGIGVHLKQLDFRYARSQYQSGTGTHQIGLQLQW